MQKYTIQYMHQYPVKIKKTDFFLKFQAQDFRLQPGVLCLGISAFMHTNGVGGKLAEPKL